MSKEIRDREQAIEQFQTLLDIKRKELRGGELNVSAFSRTEDKIFVMTVSEFKLK